MMIKAGPNVVLEQRAIIIITVITIRDSYLYWEGGEKRQPLHLLHKTRGKKWPPNKTLGKWW